jgi:hypothetical protein
VSIWEKNFGHFPRKKVFGKVIIWGKSAMDRSKFTSKKRWLRRLASLGGDSSSLSFFVRRDAVLVPYYFIFWMVLAFIHSYSTLI